jgi:nitroreductase
MRLEVVFIITSLQENRGRGQFDFGVPLGGKCDRVTRDRILLFQSEVDMDALTAISKRKSSRRYQAKPIPRDVLEKIVDAGRLAATARNEQLWDFVVITERPTLNELGKLADHGPFIAQASACIAVLCKDGKYFLEDGSAATENMLVAATALGVGSCWVAGDKKPYAAAVVEKLKAPAGHRLVSLIPLGYPEQEDHPVRKRPLKDVLHWEKF